MRFGNIFSEKKLDYLTLSTVLEQILVDCEDGVSYNLVSLLKSKPDLFYLVLGIPSTFTHKHTNILNQIISYRNTELLNALLDAGLYNTLKDVFEKTQYNILYSDNPNQFFQDEKEMVLHIQDSEQWNSILSVLLRKKLLPLEKIDKFSWAIINKPETLRAAFHTDYFSKPHDEYWEKGLFVESSSWVMIDFINSVLLNDVSEFKEYCIKDFEDNSENVSYLNEQTCFYLPDFLIFHDLFNDLKNLIFLDKKKTKHWFLTRKYKISKDDLEKRIFSIYKDCQWQSNWNKIHQEYTSPWHFLLKKSFVSDSTVLEINSLDYAFLCQSAKCYSIIEDLVGRGSLLQEHLNENAPDLIKSFLFSQKLDKKLNYKNKASKIVKV